MSSRWNDRNDVDFTLEAYVMCKKEKPVYKRAIAEDRIGFLKGRKDNWYNLKSDVGAEELGKEIEQDVTKYVLPFFQGHENVSKRRKLK